MKADKPRVIVLAGPNGAGKTTTAPMLLRNTLAVEEFVNADALAQGLSAFAPEKAAVAAGRIMLARLSKLAEKRMNFAFETTLAARCFAPKLKGLMDAGYKSHLIFLALPNVEMAVHRVSKRVCLGGHNIPEYDIKRRFESGLNNFFRLYRSVVSSWMFYDNSSLGRPILSAVGIRGVGVKLHNSWLYEIFSRKYRDEQ